MTKKLSIAMVALALFACEGPEGPAGKNSLLKLTDESPGANCAAGGVRIDSGMDANSDGVLNTEEIDATNYVCNGQDGGSQGTNSLLKTSEEPAGENCTNGGFKIETGADTNANGNLDAGEVTSVNFVCNGNDGDTENQVRFLLAVLGETSAVGYSGTDGYLVGYVDKFDKRDYVGVTSIVFSPKVYTSNSLHPVYVELYNLTDNEVVTGSIVSPTSAAIGIEQAEILHSANIYSTLPEKEISLSIRIRTANSATSLGLTGQNYLIMERN